MSDPKPTKLVVSAKSPKPDLHIEVEWDKRKKQKYLKVEMGGVKSKLIAEDFWKAAFICAPKTKQEELIPVVDKKTYHVYKTLKIQAKEDVKAGDIITVHAKLAIPPEVIDDITGQKRLEKAIPSYDRLTVTNDEKQTPETYGDNSQS